MQTHTTALFPYWSRIIHRLHALREIETNYLNSIATLNCSGKYPRHIPSSTEMTSATVDGSVCWNYAGWSTGLIYPPENPYVTGPSIHFLSSKAATFHIIKLLNNEHDQCLNCIIKLFGGRQLNKISTSPPPVTANQQGIDPESMWRKIENLCSPTGTQPATQIDLITPGGLISKSMHFQSMKFTNRKLTISALDNHQLTLDPAMTSSLVTHQTNRSSTTTLFDFNHQPIVHIKHCA